MSNALRGLLNVDEIQAGELATGCLCVGEVKKKRKKEKKSAAKTYYFELKVGWGATRIGNWTSSLKTLSPCESWISPFPSFPQHST